MSWHNTLINKLSEHSILSKSDLAVIRKLPGAIRTLSKGEDILRQGDKPTDAVVVLEGYIARYHTVQSGRRQYLSFHMAGDMPDSQTLFLETMDFSLCAMDKSLIALVPHKSIIELFLERPDTGTAFWKETLIDAAIFREAITNNSSRNLIVRLAHFFCEQYYRARKSDLTEGDLFRLPLTQTQLGETLASSLPSISRALVELRKTKALSFDNGVLQVKNWKKLAEIGDFNPTYLHLKKPTGL
jgi:CRP-like cAMP-binding protein